MDISTIINLLALEIGIENNNLSNLFKVESDDTTLGTNNEKGTEIGLALCKEFAQKNRDEIWVKSTVNRGSTFYLSLPK